VDQDSLEGTDIFGFSGWNPGSDVSDFLMRVEGPLCKQLKLNAESHAFDGSVASVWCDLTLGRF
jgi:hypothetical protein